MPRIFTQTSLSTPSPDWCPVHGYPDRMEVVREVFKKSIEPLYGPQDDALDKISRSEGRKCRLLREENQYKGLVVYKTQLSDEFRTLGISQSVEIKTLLVINSEKNSGKGIGTKLLNKVIKFAQDLRAHAVHVTVSENRTDSLAFFKNKKFVIQKTFPDKYKKGVSEHLLKLALLPSITTGTKRKLDELLTEEAPKEQTAPLNRPPIRITLRDQYLQMIKNGTKTVEGRINSGMFKGMPVGQMVCFFSHRDEVCCMVTKKVAYSSFAELLKREGYQKCVPDQCTLDQAIALYRNIPGYALKEKQHGVLALHVKVQPHPVK